MQKKRYIIELADGVYLKSECLVLSTEIIGEAKRLGKNEAIENLEQLRWVHPAAQILKWKSPKPGRWEPLKQKTKLQPVTHWGPLKASNEAKTATVEKKFVLTVITRLELKLITPPFLTAKAKGIAINTPGVMRVLSIGKGSAMIDLNPCFAGVADALSQRLESGLLFDVPVETKESKPVADSEARGLDSSEVARWHYSQGLELLGDAFFDSREIEGKTIVYTKLIERNFNALVLGMKSHGFELRGWGKVTNCEWGFDWHRWEAETKEAEAEAGAMCDTCNDDPDECHTEAHCPKTVS